MEEWKRIAINRIKEIITCIEKDDLRVEELTTQPCPVCTYMGSEYGIVPANNLKENSCHGGLTGDGLVKYCEAWESCNEFVNIVASYLIWWPKRVRSMFKNRCIRKLQNLIITLNE